MVAQGRASAWGGAPHSCSPSAGGKRPRLVSRALRPRSRRRPQREPRETDAAGAPLSSAQEACWVQAKRLHAGSGTAWRERGRPKSVSVGY